MPSARSTLNRTPESYKINFQKTPKGEVALRQIVEEIQHTQPFGSVSFTTSDVPCRADMFYIDDLIQVDGPHHKKQSSMNHDGFMMQKAAEEGYRVWRFTEEEVLFCRVDVKEILTRIAVMKRVLLEKNRK